MNESILHMRVGSRILKELQRTKGPLTDYELWEVLSSKMLVTQEEVTASRRWLVNTNRVVPADGQGSARILWGLPQETKK